MLLDIFMLVVLTTSFSIVNIMLPRESSGRIMSFFGLTTFVLSLIYFVDILKSSFQRKTFLAAESTHLSKLVF